MINPYLKKFHEWSESKVNKYHNQVFMEVCNPILYAFFGFIITYIFNLVLFLLLGTFINNENITGIINSIIFITLEILIIKKVSYKKLDRFISNNNGEVGLKNGYYYKLIFILLFLSLIFGIGLTLVINVFLLPDEEVFFSKTLNTLPYLVGLTSPFIYYLMTFIKLNKLNNEKRCPECGRLKSLCDKIPEDNEYPIYIESTNLKSNCFCKYCSYVDTIEEVSDEHECAIDYLNKIDVFIVDKLDELNKFKPKSKFIPEFFFEIGLFLFLVCIVIKLTGLLYIIPIRKNGVVSTLNKDYIYAFPDGLSILGYTELKLNQIIYLITYIINTYAGVTSIIYFNIINNRSFDKFYVKSKKSYLNMLTLDVFIKTLIKKN